MTFADPSGVLPVLQTPYHDDERIDYDTLAREIDWLFAEGVDGLVIAMVSEVLRLTEAERRELAEFVCRRASQWSSGDGGRADGGRPVVVSVGAESSFASCELARHAEAVGAAAVMAIPPLSIALEEDQLRIYYERILEAIAIPVIVQDASGYVGKPMSIEFQARLREDFGPRVQYKPEAAPIGPRLTELLNATGGKGRVFEGSGGSELVDSHRRGIVGTMPGADLIDAIVALWNALERGDAATAQRIDAALRPLLALQSSLDSYLAVEKHLLHRRGIFRNTRVRGPVGFVLDDATRDEVDRHFAALQQTLEDLQ
ncbi:dihydrodipicolinate synthase family protein [Candidatus Laterigemmans baculatus]|uniref:dihydrodipicolinate synthase family protein n=1 Tax=Candidatus Laterigemmans baculatus TaxID=2770505 RepID=UPI0013DCBBE9|nr:dihydrodipicolinate synthase family protein [Candidatus Laterigemmans baculatus]